MHWYRIAEQVVSSGKIQEHSIMDEGLKGIHLCGAMVLVQRTAGIHTLSAVDLVSSVQTVGFSVAHKQRVQRRVAAALLSGPHCQEINNFTKRCPGPKGREPE